MTIQTATPKKETIPSRPQLKVIEGGRKTRPDQFVQSVINSFVNPAKPFTKSEIATWVEAKTDFQRKAEEKTKVDKGISISKLTGEERIALRVLQAEATIICISEDIAASMGQASSYLFDTFPNTPIIFENVIAEKEFVGASFCDRHRAHCQVLGHFTNAASFNSFTISGADMIIAFGQISENLSEIFPGADIISHRKGDIQSRINFAVVNQMRKKLVSGATLTI